MSAPAYVTFPDIALPGNGGEIRIELFTQQLRPTISAPYLSSPVFYNVNPWLVDGIPETTEEQLPEEGIFGGNSQEFIFADLELLPGYSLYDLLHEDEPEAVVWHIRMYHKAVGGSFSNPAVFHGILEPADHAGEITTWGSRVLNTYKVIARNPIYLLERISIADWVASSAWAALTEQALTTIVDGDQLAGIFHNDGATPDVFYSASLARYLSLHDLMESVNDLLVFGTSVNDGHADGLARWHSWDLVYKDTGGVDRIADLDDVVLWYRIYSATLYLRHHTFFDNENHSSVSMYNLGNVLEFLKVVLVPWGCVASFRPNASGGLYLEIREVETGTTRTVAEEELLMGMEISEGERAKEGFRVVVNDAGECVAASGGGGSIDSPYICASRIRGGERWVHPRLIPYDQHTDDLPALYRGVFVNPGTSYAYSVYSFTVRNAGSGGAVHAATISTDPSLRKENGLQHGYAALEYWYEHFGSPTVLPEGIFRRYTKTLKFSRGLLDKTTLLGDAMQLPGGGLWIVRKKAIKWFELRTEYECERGTLEA